MRRQRHHHRGQARLHVERAVAAARVVRVARDLGESVARPRAVVDEEHRAVAVRDFQQRPHRFGVTARQEGVARYLRADHARQPERPLEFGGGGGNVRQGQRGVGGEAAGMLLANRGKPVVDGPAQRPGHVQRLGLDPAERAEERQHAHLDPLAVHPGEMEIEVVEGLGERLFAHPRGLQHLDAVRVAQDARFPVRARRASAISAGLQWACMSIIMAVSSMGRP